MCIQTTETTDSVSRARPVPELNKQIDKLHHDQNGKYHGSQIIIHLDIKYAKNVDLTALAVAGDADKFGVIEIPG